MRKLVEKMDQRSVAEIRASKTTNTRCHACNFDPSKERSLKTWNDICKCRRGKFFFAFSNSKF